MGLKVIAFTRYERRGASSRVRFLQYIPHLEQRGAQIDVRPLFPDSYLTQLYATGTRPNATVVAAMIRRLGAALALGDADVIWLQREILPYLPFFAENLLLSGKPLVIDFDDAHHLYYRKSSALFANKTDRLMRRATIVTVGNQTLFDYARSAGATNVQLLPSAVDVPQFKKTAFTSEFTVGWIGTPVTAAEALPLVEEPLARFLTETSTKCILVGARPGQFPNLNAEYVPWGEGTEADVLARVSVGLCPLADTAWNRGKSGYKIIQYMAAGRATLTSPVGIAAGLVEQGTTGFHCVTPDDWYTKLIQLHGDRALCASLGAHAQQIAARKYDTAVVAAQLYDLFAAAKSST
jgi:glycosyltransferase involved in cell wall biosynthesis